MKEIGFRDVEIDLSDFKLPKTTKEVKPKISFIYQDRAYEALSDAMNLDDRNYNVFITGPNGSGKHTFVREFLSQVASKMPTPDDWIYVYNFSNPSSPRAISMAPGHALKFRSSISELKKEILEAIKRVFESDDYSKKRRELDEKYATKKKDLWDSLNKKSIDLGFSVQIAQTGIMTIPMAKGKPLSQEDFEGMDDGDKKFYENNIIKVKGLIDGTLHKSRKLDLELKSRIDKLDKEVAKFAIDPLFEELNEAFFDDRDVVNQIKLIKEDVLDNLGTLRDDQTDKDKFMSRYDVNVAVDNSETQGAPIVEELNPTYANLFGKVEYYATMGTLQTDFRFIRPGAFHRANGGFIILNIEDVLRSTLAWEATKRLLNSGHLKIENIQEYLGYGITVTLSPEPIPMDIKIVMIGETWIYEMLYAYESDFRKFFKIKAPFDWEIDANEKGIDYYLHLLKSIVDSKHLLHVSKSGIQEIIKVGMRLVEKRNKLSTQANRIMALLVESNQKAKASNKKHIDAEAVTEALKAMERRHSLEESRMLEFIKSGEIMIETSGKKIGQINGLTVLEGGDYPFGMPVKIIAKTHLADMGVLDIQREANMSGKIFTKAVLIITNYLNSKYAMKMQPALAATLSFEQTYSTIEGDSASLAETLAVISAISKVPIDQSVAVTGSINQNGDVQPVGGVPYKIEGFFKVCKDKGLDGNGVIIPSLNANDLVLDSEIVRAVKEGKFHIWTVDTVDEAVEIIMGKPAGAPGKNMDYPKGTVSYMVLREMEKASKLREKSEETSKSKKRKKTKASGKNAERKPATEEKE